jgi:hypothetical protein
MIGTTLREVHLKYHLSTVAVLTESPRQRDSELRGYGANSSGHRHRHN